MKTKITTFVFTFVLMLLMAFSTHILAQEIINENGDFSDADIGDNSGITNWALEGTDFATFEVVEDPDDAGNQVLRVEITDIGSVGDNWDIQPLHQNTELVAGESYTVSVRVKADNAGDGTPTISLDPGYNAQYDVDISGSSDWQTVEIDLFNATASASQQVGIHLGSDNNADGDIFYLDDLEIVNEDEPALWSFESGSYADWNLGDIGGMLNITDEFVMAGDSALQVTAVDSSLETNFQNDVFDNIAAGDTIKYNIYITSEDLDLVNGFQAFWHSPEWAYNSEWLGTEGITADEWSTIEFVMPEYDEPLNRIGLQMLLSEGNETATPSLYMDDISVTPGVESEPEPEPTLAWDFEDQELGDWTLQDATGGISDAQAFEGTYSAEVSVNDDAANGALINDNQDIAPGDSLIFQVYVPADHIDDINALQTFIQYSDDWVYIDSWFDSSGLTTDDWNKVFYVVPDSIEGETIQRIGLQVTGSEASGTPTVYVDNIQIVEFSEDDPGPGDLPVPEPPYAVGDTINYNGSFELSDLGELEAGDHLDHPTPAWDVLTEGSGAATFTIVEDSEDDDNRALMVEFEGIDTNPWGIEILNQPVNMAEGDTYQYTVSLKADTDTRIAHLEIGRPGPDYGGDANWTSRLSEEVTLSTEWTEYTFEFQPNAEDLAADFMRAPFKMSHDANDGATIYIDNLQIEKVDGVSNEGNTQPLTYELNQNYPNPFNPSTTISYTIPEAADVKLEVYNILGQRVLTLIDEHQSAGVKQVNFDASNLASGVYLYRIQTDNFMQSRRMTLIK